MKRLTRFLTRFYPLSWRHRYGDEFDALLDQSTPSARDAADVLKGAVAIQLMRGHYGRTLLVSGLFGLLAALSISSLLPRSFQSVATVAVSQREVRMDTGRAAGLPVWNAIIELNQLAFSDSVLASIIQRDRLYPGERSHLSLSAVIERMRKNIVFRSVANSSRWTPFPATYVIQFRHPDAKVAQSVAVQLTTSLIEANLRQAELNSALQLQVLDPASLPSKLSRCWIATGGLFVGLLAGLTVAFVRKSRAGVHPHAE